MQVAVFIIDSTSIGCTGAQLVARPDLCMVLVSEIHCAITHICKAFVLFSLLLSLPL